MRGGHGDDLTECSGAHVVCAPHSRRRRFPDSLRTGDPWRTGKKKGGPLLSRPYPFGFLFDPSLRETRGGFEPTINLAWFDGLHMPLETPGCESLEAACDDGACRGR